MGIDFSHCDASWSYSGFGNFRRRLWNGCGFTGDLYELYEDQLFKDQIRKDHALYPFFDHSDCGGELSPEEMYKIVPVIRTIITVWDDDDYDKIKGLELLKGMCDAINSNENLEFC